MARAPSITERKAVIANIKAELQQNHLERAITIESDWARRYPTDFEVRHNEPLLYRLNNDGEAWERARADLLQTWVASRGKVPLPASPSFTVDIFKAGPDTVIADQCYEPAGRFGVLYRFTVIGADHRPASFFTVESPDADNQIVRDLDHPTPVYTLDHFRPGMHETVARLPGVPLYSDLRQRVLDYVAAPHPLSTSTSGGSALSTEGCGVNPAARSG